MKRRSERIAERSGSRREPQREKKKRKYEKGYYKTHPCTTGFTCRVCGWPVSPEGAGSGHRNHCPNCLSSLHVDEEPGDRASSCHGVMKAVAVWVRSNGEWAIIHECTKCGKLDSNRTAADDNPMKLMALALKPFGSGRIRQERVRSMIATMDDPAMLK